MPLHPTSQFLVNAIESTPLLDGRFEHITLVNFDAVADAKRGFFSLVFKAHDRSTDSAVALKFFDPGGPLDPYRITAFRREHQILESLLGVPGCVQLASGLTMYHLPVPTAAPGPTPSIPCEYFALEWIEEEIDGYFLCQETFTADEKLTLFGQVASAVAVLHSRGVFHRDLKPDNMRMMRNGGQRSVVAIDMGTAARYASTPIAPGYGAQVGAYPYSAPEALCGLAGNRKVAPKTDLYALGCMLFELFNKDYFFNTLVTRNPSYIVLLTAMRTYIKPGTSDDQQREDWQNALSKHGNSVVPVPVDGAGSDIPPGVAALVNEISLSLTDLDYRRRPQLSWVHGRLKSALAVLRNEKAYNERLKRAKEIRARKIEKIKQREARLSQRLSQRGALKGVDHGNQ
jgi:serine/threonine protein kinase